MRAALARAEQILGRRIPITSGYRSQRQQAALFFRRAANPFPVAPPGTSMHERGLAVDVPVAIADELAAVGRQAGLCRPYARTDPVHFELCAR
jgi:LAS superfamily LD-carboxypeptidase LdcB